MNKLSERLDDLVGRTNGEYEVSSTLSSSLSRASISNPEEWSLLYPDFVEAGFPRDLLSEQLDYIQRWLMNAFIAGRIDAVSQQGDEGEASTVKSNGQLVQHRTCSTLADDEYDIRGQDSRAPPSRSSL